MPVTHPWLAGPSPSQRLPREVLEERILNLLSSQNMCVLATTGESGTAATPVRYFHLGTLTVVTPRRIVYTEHWLRRDGYSPRQFWKADEAYVGRGR